MCDDEMHLLDTEQDLSLEHGDVSVADVVGGVAAGIVNDEQGSYYGCSGADRRDAGKDDGHDQRVRTWRSLRGGPVRETVYRRSQDHHGGMSTRTRRET